MIEGYNGGSGGHQRRSRTKDTTELRSKTGINKSQANHKSESRTSSTNESTIRTRINNELELIFQRHNDEDMKQLVTTEIFSLENSATGT